jgi:aspartokinase-like uncharacterized kinase
MPTRMVLADPAIAASWDITSDSLAAWLAGKLGARRLVLVKSVLVANGATAAALARRGIVDPAFPDYLARSGAEGWCIDDRRSADMARALAEDRGPGTRIVAKPRRLPRAKGMLTSRPDRPRTRRQ